MPAKDDPDLDIAVYYLRVNVFGHLLTSWTSMMFAQAWDGLGSLPMSGFRRSKMAGAILVDLIRALALEEISQNEAPETGWFVHSGVTKYSRRSGSTVKQPCGLRAGGH